MTGRRGAAAGLPQREVVDMVVLVQFENAITGDYRITLRASVPQAQDQIEVRATVETSAIWGFAGVAIIVVALAALGVVFRRFGRR